MLNKKFILWFWVDVTTKAPCFLSGNHIKDLKYSNKLSLALLLALASGWDTETTMSPDWPYHSMTISPCLTIGIYVSTLPGGDGRMLHSVHVVIIRGMAISDTPVSICRRISSWSYPTTAEWRIRWRLSPTAVDVVSRGIPHSESINTLHCRDLTLLEGPWKISLY